MWFVAPEEEAGEAKSALARLPEPVRERIVFHGVDGTEETRALLDVGGRRRWRPGRLAAAVLAVFATVALAGHLVWRDMTGDWNEMWRQGRYLELDRALDGFAVPTLAGLFRDGLRKRAISLEMWITARRPNDGGACAGLRFRRGAAVADAERLPPGPVYRPDRPRSLCGFTLRASAGEAGEGRIVLLSLLQAAVDSPPIPTRRTASGAAAGTVALAHVLPLYRDPSWSWDLIAVWAPTASDDLTRLAARADPARLRALGLTVLRARLELGGYANEQGNVSGKPPGSAGSRFVRHRHLCDAGPQAPVSNREQADSRWHREVASCARSRRAKRDRVPGAADEAELTQAFDPPVPDAGLKGEVGLAQGVQWSVRLGERMAVFA